MIFKYCPKPGERQSAIAFSDFPFNYLYFVSNLHWNILMKEFSVLIEECACMAFHL